MFQWDIIEMFLLAVAINNYVIKGSEKKNSRVLIVIKGSRIV